MEQLKIIVQNFRKKQDEEKKVDYFSSDKDLFEDFDEGELQKFSIFRVKESVFKPQGEVAEIEKGDLIGELIEKEEEEENENENKPENKMSSSQIVITKIPENSFKRTQSMRGNANPKDQKEDPFGGKKPKIKITR